MDIGIALPQAGREASPTTIVRVAQEAEQLGYASVWTFERLLRPIEPIARFGEAPRALPEAYKTVYDPIETLTYVAAKTERIKLGTSVLNALFHTPVMLGRRLATLDQLSGGRVIAGLGQGWMEQEFQTSNVPLKRRGNGFEEFINALRAVWGSDPVQFEGRFYTIAPSEIGPKPLQAGGIPILIGAATPVALARAAVLGDGINPGAWSWEYLEQGISSFKQQARAAGRDPEKLPVVVRANAQLYSQSMGTTRPPFTGTTEEIAEDVAHLSELGGTHVFFAIETEQTSVADQLRFMTHLSKRVR